MISRQHIVHVRRTFFFKEERNFKHTSFWTKLNTDTHKQISRTKPRNNPMYNKGECYRTKKNELTTMTRTKKEDEQN